MAATLDDLLNELKRLNAATGGQSPSSVLTQANARGIANAQGGGGGILGRLTRGVQGATRAVQGATGGAGAGVGGALRGAGAALGGVGAVAGGVVAFGAALYEAGKAVREFASEQEATARRLAQVSPSQAANIAQLDVNRTFRDLEQGEATAGSGKEMTESIDRFEAAILPLETAILDLKNSIASGLMDVLTTVIGVIVDVINEIRSWLVKKPLGADKEPGPEIFGDFLKRIAEEEERKERKAAQRIDAARRAGQPA